MGTYTTFTFDATLKQDVPPPLLAYIRMRLGTRGLPVDQQPKLPDHDVGFDDHPFFNTERWDWILTWHNCNNHGFNSYSEDTPHGLRIHIDTQLKNYADTIQWFLMWVAPLVDISQPCTAYACAEDYTHEDEAWLFGDCSLLIHHIVSAIVHREPFILTVLKPSTVDLTVLKSRSGPQQFSFNIDYSTLRLTDSDFIDFTTETPHEP